MLNLIPEYHLLNECLKKQTSFQEACFKVRTTTSMSSLTNKYLPYNGKIILNHYFSLSFEIYSLFENLNRDDKEVLFLIVYLSHIKYLKDDLINLKESFLTEAKELNLSLNEDDFNKIKDRRDRSYLDFIKDSDNKILSLSLRNELPLVLLEMMMKKYNKDEAIRLLKNLHGKEHYLYLNNNDVKPIEKKLYEYPSLLNAKFLAGRIDINSPLIKEKGIIKSSLPVIKSLDGLNLNFPYTKILFSNLKRVTIPVSLYNVLNSSSVQITSFVKNSLYYRRAKEYNDNKNIIYNNAPIELIKTYQSYNLDNIVFTFGISTLSLNRNDPSILIKFDKNELNNEYKVNLTRLFETCKFTNYGGYFIYINHSFLNDVNEKVTKAFLDERKDFELIKEENIIPFDNLVVYDYYAVFKRREK